MRPTQYGLPRFVCMTLLLTKVKLNLDIRLVDAKLLKYMGGFFLDIAALG